MPIKQLEAEKNNKGMLMRFLIVFALLVVGIVLNKWPTKKINTNKILGMETKNKISLEKKGEDLKSVLDNEMDKAKNSLDNVLGETTSFIASTASKSAEIVTDFIFDNTVGNIIKQINKLPEKQQQEIKERVCQ